MSGKVTLYAASVESLNLEIRTPSDPTGNDPEFALSALGADEPGTFAAGTWVGDWNSATGWTLAVTPTIGAAGTAVLEVESGDTYRLWARVSLGNEVAVWPVGSIRVP